MKLNPPETAPRDGTVILGHFGMPWLVSSAWNEHDEEWVYATLQACEMKNGTVDNWFENERESHSELIGWLPMPEIP